MEEYIARRGYGLITDREIRVALGISQGKLSRLKVRLAHEGKLSYRVISRSGGTEYRPVQGAVQSGASKPKLTKVIQMRERETRPRVREAAEQDPVLAAWAKYRGRALIEEEVAELASWQAALGTERLIELIAQAWRRCTADRMSVGYVYDYFIEPALEGRSSGANKAVQRRGARKPVQKHKPAATPIKETTPQKSEVKKKPAVEKPWAGFSKRKENGDDPRGTTDATAHEIREPIPRAVNAARFAGVA